MLSRLKYEKYLHTRFGLDTREEVEGIILIQVLVGTAYIVEIDCDSG